MKKIKFIGESDLYFRKGNVYNVYKRGDKKFVINDILMISFINENKMKNFEVIK